MNKNMIRVKTIFEIPNNQERASELYTPVHPSKEAQICLNCTNKKCKPRSCKRYTTEHKKIQNEQH